MAVNSDVQADLLVSFCPFCIQFQFDAYAGTQLSHPYHIFIQTFLPTYFRDDLQMPLSTVCPITITFKWRSSQNGAYTMIPFVVQIFMRTACSMLADSFKRKVNSTTFLLIVLFTGNSGSNSMFESIPNTL